MEKKTIILPENLQERRLLLKQELNAVIEVQTTEGLTADLKNLLNQAGFTSGKAVLDWEFYGEYDDEGGTDYRPSGISLYVNGENIEMDEVTFLYSYTAYNGEERSYDSELRDHVIDTMYEYSDDLYDIYITEITVPLDDEEVQA